MARPVLAGVRRELVRLSGAWKKFGLIITSRAIIGCNVVLGPSWWVRVGIWAEFPDALPVVRRLLCRLSIVGFWPSPS